MILSLSSCFRFDSSFNQNLPTLKDLLNSKTQSLTQTIRDTMNILNSTAEKCSNQRKYGKNKLKLNIWNNNIKDAIKHNKIAHKESSDRILSCYGSGH
jgi:hypothetical protein